MALMKGVYSAHTAAPCWSPAHGKGDTVLVTPGLNGLQVVLIGLCKEVDK